MRLNEIPATAVTCTEEMDEDTRNPFHRSHAWVKGHIEHLSVAGHSVGGEGVSTDTLDCRMCVCVL